MTKSKKIFWIIWFVAIAIVGTVLTILANKEII